MKKIDKTPPVASGNVAQDLENIINYLTYMREQINFVISQLEKEAK